MDLLPHDGTNGGLRVLPDKRASVVVIGGGVAGLWIAYQLLNSGIETVLVSYELPDRGELQGASRPSVAAGNTQLLDAKDLDEYLQRIGQGQTHPSVATNLTKYLPRTLVELREIIGPKPIKISVASAVDSEGFLAEMQRRVRGLEGEIVNGWVTRLVANEAGCTGVQYQTESGIGKIRCRAVVIASGDYAGLFANSIRTNCFGSMLGLYLACGGIATNLELLSKHGYETKDGRDLTPTEQFPGAGIYEVNGGIGHVDFATNLPSVYVTGEATHDFGANRVGELAWSLCLASAYRIVDQIEDALTGSRQPLEDFDVIPKKARFDAELLAQIRDRLYEAQESELTTANGQRCTEWLRKKRRELAMSQDLLNDGISWLLVAEAVMQCSLCRKKSRGFFFRQDYQEPSRDLDHFYSYAWYDPGSDEVKADLGGWPQVAAMFRNSTTGKGICHDLARRGSRSLS